MGRWGTWEELLLGAAVLRHGIQDWNVIADELRIRVCPYTFTPEVCKAKYEDLQQRYSGNMALLYEELRKARIKELKKAIEGSDDTIGSLELKLEVLKAEKNETKDDCENDIESPVSHTPSQKLEKVKSSTEETTKDDLSAGSFTHQTRINWSPESQVPAASADDNETRPEVSQSTEQTKVSQSKLEVLKAEKNVKKDDCENDLESPVSHTPSHKLEKVKSSTEETTKDDLSAGSFTHTKRTNRSPESQVPVASADDNETKSEVSQSTEHAKFSQSKLEVFKDEKNKKKDDCKNGLESPISHLPSQKLEKVELSTKEISKDGLSVGSFTQETNKNCSPKSQVPIASANDNEAKPEVSQSNEQTKVLNADSLALTLYEIQVGCCKKRRGKRKRKDCGSNIKEAAASVEESDLLDSADVLSQCKESSTGNCGEVAKISADVDGRKNKNLKKHSAKDMIKILDSIFETNGASAFRRRLDGQKRGTYKKMIKQHMDFDTIRSRIISQTIKYPSKLFRDLLLLTNNVLVFYSKFTREYKTAFLLRDIVNKKIRESSKCSTTSSNKVIEPNDSIKLPVQNLHVKPRSVRQGNRKIIAKVDGSKNSASSQGAKKPVKAADPSPSMESLNVMKKAFGRQKKVEPVTSSQKIATQVKGKKRVRTNS